MRKDLETYLYQIRITAEIHVVEMVRNRFPIYNICNIKWNYCWIWNWHWNRFQILVWSLRLDWFEYPDFIRDSTGHTNWNLGMDSWLQDSLWYSGSNACSRWNRLWVLFLVWRRAHILFIRACDYSGSVGTMPIVQSHSSIDISWNKNVV